MKKFTSIKNISFFYITLDINVYDIHGQSLMHEVAREWNLDLAEYLKLRGAQIDHPDKWGRTPLFVAVVSNHVEMARWLIENGGKWRPHNLYLNLTFDLYLTLFNFILQYSKNA